MTLITDHRSAVSARLLPDGPDGVVEPEVGDPEDLLLDFIDERRGGQGGPDPGHRRLVERADLLGLPVRDRDRPRHRGGVGEQETFQQVHVEPFADMRELDFVQVLTGGPERPGVGG